MHIAHSINGTVPRRRTAIFVLALLWILGMVFGVCTAYSAGDTFSSLMRSAAYSRVSIVGLLTVISLPFLYTAFAVYLSKPLMIYPLCFVKAFSFGLCAYAVSMVFGSAAWLVRLLFLFTDNASVVLLWFVWIRFIGAGERYRWQEAAVAAAFAVFLGAFDYFAVSPFWASLINF